MTTQRCSWREEVYRVSVSYEWCANVTPGSGGICELACKPSFASDVRYNVLMNPLDFTSHNVALLNMLRSSQQVLVAFAHLSSYALLFKIPVLPGRYETYCPSTTFRCPGTADGVADCFDGNIDGSGSLRRGLTDSLRRASVKNSRHAKALPAVHHMSVTAMRKPLWAVIFALTHPQQCPRYSIL